MTVKRTVTTLALLAGFALTTTAVTAAEPEYEKNLPEAVMHWPHNWKVKYPVLRSRMPCMRDMTFYHVDGTHWQKDQKIRLIGPLPNGKMKLIALPSTPPHKTASGPYNLVDVSGLVPPQIFEVTTTVSEPGKHPPDEQHLQWIYVSYDLDNCPDGVLFDAAYDLHDGDVHGGHAAAN